MNDTHVGFLSPIEFKFSPKIRVCSTLDDIKNVYEMARNHTEILIEYFGNITKVCKCDYIIVLDYFLTVKLPINFDLSKIENSGVTNSAKIKVRVFGHRLILVTSEKYRLSALSISFL